MSTPELRLVHPARQPQNEAPTEPRYWAFISYSHRDSKQAAALQRALETYRLPRRLVGRGTPRGPVPESVRPVFRDRDELPASTDLKSDVREALAASRWLIVLCSPASARSDWVNREIAEFKRLHGEHRALAVIVDGEPFASRLPGRAEEECFPPALRFRLDAHGDPTGEPLEPIAVDLRPQGDGRRLAVLKLVAGMTGVGVDELARRDAQRRARQLTWIALGATAGMLVMAVLAFTAVRARDEARMQRAQAEDLIEFMLGDLRRKLEPVGRLDVLDAVGERALAHYARQEAGSLDADALSRRARALLVIGQIREKRGDLGEALKAFDAAKGTTAQLLAAAPGDGQRIFEHAQAVFWSGYIAYLRRQPAPAEAAFEEYYALAQRLVALDPANLDWRLEVVYARQNLGNLLLESGRPAEALRAFLDARDAYAPVVAQRPQSNFDLANTWGWIAKAQETLGQFAAAIESQRTKNAVALRVPDADTNRLIKRLIANGEIEIARLHAALGQLDDARTTALESIAHFDALIALDPTNVSWQFQGISARLTLAEIELGRGNVPAALALIDRNAPGMARLYSGEATQRGGRTWVLARVLALRAEAAQAAGAMPDLASLEALAAEIARQPPPRLNLESASVLTRADLELGDVYVRAGQTARALTLWRTAADRIAPYAADSPAAATQLARLQLRLGEADAGRQTAARIESSAYRHPDAVQLLREAQRGTGPRIGLAALR